MSRYASIHRSYDQTARISLQITNNVKQQGNKTDRSRQNHLAPTACHARIVTQGPSPAPRQKTHLGNQNQTAKPKPNDFFQNPEEPVQPVFPAFPPEPASRRLGEAVFRVSDRRPQAVFSEKRHACCNQLFSGGFSGTPPSHPAPPHPPRQQNHQPGPHRQPPRRPQFIGHQPVQNRQPSGRIDLPVQGFPPPPECPDRAIRGCRGQNRQNHPSRHPDRQIRTLHPRRLCRPDLSGSRSLMTDLPAAGAGARAPRSPGRTSVPLPVQAGTSGGSPPV